MESIIAQMIPLISPQVIPFVFAAQGGSTTQTVNANQPDNPSKVVNIIGWKRIGG